MPNHITNVITVKDTGDTSLSDIRKTFLNGDNEVDFNILAPVPECLKDFNPHSGIVGAAKALVNADISGNPLIGGLERSNRQRDVANYKGFGPNPFNDEERQQVDRAVTNYKECGAAYWYDWQVDHWGTKWNAYGQPDGGHPADAMQYKFETAWSHPRYLMELISRKLPDVLFLIEYADEDLGSNCGSYEIKNGVKSHVDIAPGWDSLSDEQKSKYVEFAFKLQYPDEDPRAHGYGEDWQYSDEVYEQYEAEQGE